MICNFFFKIKYVIVFNLIFILFTFFYCCNKLWPRQTTSYLFILLNLISYHIDFVAYANFTNHYTTKQKEERKIYRLKTALKIMCHNKLFLYLRHHEDSTNPGMSLIRIIFLFLMKSERKYYNSKLIILYIISGWVRLTHSTWIAKL